MTLAASVHTRVFDIEGLNLAILERSNGQSGIDGRAA